MSFLRNTSTRLALLAVLGGFLSTAGADTLTMDGSQPAADDGRPTRGMLTCGEAGSRRRPADLALGIPEHDRVFRVRPRHSRRHEALGDPNPLLFVVKRPAGHPGRAFYV